MGGLLSALSGGLTAATSAAAGQEAGKLEGSQLLRAIQAQQVGEAEKRAQTEESLARAESLRHPKPPAPTVHQGADGTFYRVDADGTATPVSLRAPSDTGEAPGVLKGRPAPPVEGSPEWERVKQREAEIQRDYGYHPPVQPSYTPVTVVPSEGAAPVVAPFNSRTGTTGTPIGNAPQSAGNGRGTASIQKILATNAQQLSVIDDALSELAKHPDAVGLNRGLPIVGDRMDQRVDPTGVAARASIANIGSLQIHDRTGAAMTIHEEPRLAPFVPNVGDTPAAIRTKLTKLKASLKAYNDGIAHAAPSQPTGDVDLRQPAVSPLRAKYEAAVKHLRETGRAAEIPNLPVPPEE